MIKTIGCAITDDQQKAIDKIWALSKAYCRDDLVIGRFEAGELYGDRIYLSVWFNTKDGRFYKSCQFFIGAHGGIDYPVGVTGQKKRFYPDRFCRAVDDYTNN